MINVIFDMDGTLLDSQRIYFEAWEKIGREYGFKGMGEDAKKLCGMNEIGVKKYINDHFEGLDADAFRADVRAYVEANLITEFKPGAKELIDYLKSKNIKMAIASGTREASVRSHLNDVGIYDVFDAIVCGDHVENGKPAPDVFLLAAEKLGAKPKDCFVFEDSGNGIKGAASAGMKAVGVPDALPFKEEEIAIMYTKLDNLFQAIDMFEELTEE